MACDLYDLEFEILPEDESTLNDNGAEIVHYEHNARTLHFTWESCYDTYVPYLKLRNTRNRTHYIEIVNYEVTLPWYMLVEGELYFQVEFRDEGNDVVVQDNDIFCVMVSQSIYSDDLGTNDYYPSSRLYDYDVDLSNNFDNEIDDGSGGTKLVENQLEFNEWTDDSFNQTVQALQYLNAGLILTNEKLNEIADNFRTGYVELGQDNLGGSYVLLGSGGTRPEGTLAGDPQEQLKYRMDEIQSDEVIYDYDELTDEVVKQPSNIGFANVSFQIQSANNQSRTLQVDLVKNGGLHTTQTVSMDTSSAGIVEYQVFFILDDNTLGTEDRYHIEVSADGSDNHEIHVGYVNIQGQFQPLPDANVRLTNSFGMTVPDNGGTKDCENQLEYNQATVTTLLDIYTALYNVNNQILYLQDQIDQLNAMFAGIYGSAEMDYLGGSYVLVSDDGTRAEGTGTGDASEQLKFRMHETVTDGVYISFDDTTDEIVKQPSLQACAKYRFRILNDENVTTRRLYTNLYKNGIFHSYMETTLAMSSSGIVQYLANFVLDDNATGTEDRYHLEVSANGLNNKQIHEAYLDVQGDISI